MTLAPILVQVKALGSFSGSYWTTEYNNFGTPCTTGVAVAALQQLYAQTSSMAVVNTTNFQYFGNYNWGPLYAEPCVNGASWSTSGASWIRSSTASWGGVTCGFFPAANVTEPTGFERVLTDYDGASSAPGTLPSEVGHLSALLNLTIPGIKKDHGNLLTSTIPTEIGALTALTALTISNQYFTGSMPSEIGNLTAITSIDLSGSSLSGTLPTEIARLGSATSLDLTYNSFCGQIPAEISALASTAGYSWNLTSSNMLLGEDCAPSPLPSLTPSPTVSIAPTSPSPTTLAPTLAPSVAVMMSVSSAGKAGDSPHF